MNIKTIKELATTYSSEELFRFADEYEAKGEAPIHTSDDPGEQMSDYLQAGEVKKIMEQEKTPLSEALRSFSKRVRSAL